MSNGVIVLSHMLCRHNLAMNSDLGASNFNIIHVLLGQLNIHRSEIFSKVIEGTCDRNGNDEWLFASNQARAICAGVAFFFSA